jgi:two-component system sensor histidine kinase KdpD
MAAAAALGVPLVATGAGLLIGQTRTTAAALLYLLAILGVATTVGMGAGIAAALLSFLGLNYFFTPPIRTFSVSKTDDLIALVVFLSVGLVVSSLVTVGLTHRARARRMEHEAQNLYAISTRLAESDDLVPALQDLADHVRMLFALDGCRIDIARAGADPHGVAAGATDGPAPVRIPLSTSAGDVGTLRLFPRGAFGESERRVAVILARQIALSYQRTVLEREASDARVSAEANRIRRALVSAVSHDFRTPLSSIKASITALMPNPRAVSPEAADELLRTALEETERLDRLVGNLLDLARLRSGTIAPSRAEVTVEEVIDDALASLRSRLGLHQVAVSIRDDVPTLDVDPVQVGQVMRNVLENAAKFAPNGSEIRVNAVPWQSWVELRVADRGPGIDPDDREAVFEEFFRGTDSGRSGTGIGLALAQAIVRAHGGRIWIEATPGGGATVAIRLPAARAAA